MAEKKKSAAETKTAGKGKAATGSGSKAAGKSGRPIRREIWAFVCLAMAVLTLLGVLGVDALFIGWLTELLRGLIGAAIYVMPLIFGLQFAILLFHDGRPVRQRIAASIAVALCVGILLDLFLRTTEIEWKISMVKVLWTTGKTYDSGGLIAGFLAMLLNLTISWAGALIVSLVMLPLSLLYSLNMTMGSLIKAIKNRPRVEYDPPKKEHGDAAERLVNRVAQKQIQRVERKRSAISAYDLPVDEPPALPAAEKKPKSAEKKSDGPSKRDLFLEALGQPLPEPKPKARPEPDPEPEPEPEEEPIPEPVNAPAPAELPLVIPKKKEPVAAPVLEPVKLPPVTLPPLELEDDQKLKKGEAKMEAAKIAAEIAEAEEEQPQKVYAFPTADLLSKGDGTTVDGSEEMQINAERLNDTLASFNIDAHIIDVIRGPSVTRYELELERGVKLSKITNLADDIALALGATGVRIAAIPDKIAVVGIEVPNKLVSTVRIHDVIDSLEFHKSKSRISFAVGKDISGKAIVGDIAKLPHLLIAGTTGSGKSVCMNSLIISLLYKAKPEEVRMIMVDPKMVELGIYKGIPHLLIPVVTDPKKAAGALQWAVTEMMKRYQTMSDALVHNLEEYNRLCRTDETRKPMEQIVVVIDELADLMLVAAKEVEESICRIAQMGRASGIHLVIATQRPSADVITGLMKANIPSRIAFAVASAMESRIILDASGAEKLVGKGDMLYAPLGQGKPKRVQGCFITDEEVRNVVDFIKRNAVASYDDSIMAEIDLKAAQSGKSGSAAAAVAAAEPVEEGDELLPAAVDVILETGQASVSMLQRRLKLGYARAARIVDEMEEKGIVGPYEGSKPRQLLITKDQWLQMQGLEPVPEDNPPVEEEIP